VGLFLALAWLVRRNMPRSARVLPGDVVQLLGRVPLANKQQLHLLRFGNKLVLVSVFNGSAETVSEITDPQEIDRLLGLCQQGRVGSASEDFREVLEQFSAKPESPPDPASHDAIVEYHRESLSRNRGAGLRGGVRG
jgi:flagellar biogenesis protein FliO